jgi:(p)ppGpp synthase/HD superfamily hydrolase
MNQELLTHRFELALLYAAALHREQVRKGTAIPYVSHLLAVTSLVLEHGGIEDQAIAALLHDALEDQPTRTSYAEIRDRFGEAVAQIVRACSDAETSPKPPWRQRKETYLAHLRGAPADACLVSWADKLHNARAILSDYRVLGDSLWSRFNASKADILWYYCGLVDAFRDKVPKNLWEELQRTVSALRDLAHSRSVRPAV